jgi:hypothetical protein
MRPATPPIWPTGMTLTVQADGAFVLTSPASTADKRLPRVFTTASTPPEFTVNNYETVLFSPMAGQSIGQAFLNTLTVAIPATIIPILIAAFAAYALAWMEFPGRALLIAAIVGLLVVPLQLALIPLLQLHNAIGIGKGYLGIWLAHTGFGLPLAIYLLRNYMVGLPRDIIENARVDGATEFQIFSRSSCRCPSRRWPPSRSSSSSGPGTTCWWRWCSWHRQRPAGADRQPGEPDGVARRRLGDPVGLGLRVDRGAADRVLLDAAVPGARASGRLGKVSMTMKLPKDPDWWRGAVIYQIYPRSYQDSNGDGIGDLGHRRAAAAYRRPGAPMRSGSARSSLSPMKDFGYDVSDYCDVDPMFGTLADFDRAGGAAHELGLRVMIDLVLSHTSDKHPWFRKAARTAPTPRRLVCLGRSQARRHAAQQLAVDLRRQRLAWDSRREQYYLHNFLTSPARPELPQRPVQEALLDVARFWLERGVDGFRWTRSTSTFHDRTLRDNPALPEDCATIPPRPVNPYNHQLHLFDKNQPENLSSCAVNSAPC